MSRFKPQDPVSVPPLAAPLAVIWGNCRFRIFLAIAVTILLISALAPVIGGGIATIFGLAGLFLILPPRRPRADRSGRAGQ